MRKALIAFFSVSGTTACVAKEPAQAAGADMDEIRLLNGRLAAESLKHGLPQFFKGEKE